MDFYSWVFNLMKKKNILWYKNISIYFFSITFKNFIKGDVQLLMVSNAPDTAYELCSKYAPDCNNLGGNGNVPYLEQQREEQQFSDNSNKNRSRETRKKSSGKNKSKSSSKKSRKAVNTVEISAASVNTRNHQGLRANVESFIQSDDEFDNLGLGFNGEDDYYDSINSGNEDVVTNTDVVINQPGNEVAREPFEQPFDERRQYESESNVVSSIMNVFIQ